MYLPLLLTRGSGDEVVDLILSDGAPDMPFFFCWANHDWNLGWKGQPEVVTWHQDYDAPDDDSHFEWLSRAFDDPRYYRIGGAPVLAIYDPEKIPKAKEMFDRWQVLARERGFSGLVLLGFAHQTPAPAAEAVGLNAWIQGAALNGVRSSQRVLPSLKTVSGILRFLRHGDYRIHRATLKSLSTAARHASGKSLVPMVISSWNNVGRRSRRGSYMSLDPASFEGELRQAFDDAPSVHGPAGSRRLVAINAWNEWGEAMTLEPTQEHGSEMLKALKRVVDSYAEPRRGEVLVSNSGLPQ